MLTRLTPGETLGELLFGLIMVLTFTLGAGVAANLTHEEARGLMLGAIGCVVAWGVIDAVFYVMGSVFTRSRRFRLLEGFRRTADKEAALGLVRNELDEQLRPLATAEDREYLYDHIYQALRKATPLSRGLEAGDLKDAVVVFLLVSVTAIPAAVPFFLVEDPWSALRISNALLLGLLFVFGYFWAGYTGSNRWLTGLGLTAIGLILVAVAIALGG